MPEKEDSTRAGVNDLLARNREHQTEGDLQEILRRAPDSPRVLFELGNIRQRSQDHMAAIDFFERALDADPSLIEARLRLSGSLEELGMFDAAAAQLEQALSLEPDNPIVQHALGVSYQQAGKMAAAKDAYTKAIELRSSGRKAKNELEKRAQSMGWYDLCDSHNNMGIVLAALGNKEDAIRHFDMAIRLMPKHTDAVYNRAFVKKHRKVDRELQRIEAWYKKKSLSEPVRTNLGFALAKAYDDIGNYEKAARLYREANNSQRLVQPYDIDSVVDAFHSTADAFKSNPLGDLKADKVGPFTPIFIVGMPRSGSSLLEKILASHSQVYGAGELEAFSRSARSVFPYFQYDVQSATVDQLNEIAAGYFDQVEPLVAGEPRYVIDKMPRNFEYLGLVRAVFPDAKVINTVRHPLDTCLSCFQQKFTSTRQGFSNDLDDLGQYYVAHHELMRTWSELFPGWIAPVSYEDLVSDSEATIRSILSGLGLDFEAACLEHHRNSAHSTYTASAVQVTEPIHRRSVERWRNYSKLLAPLRPLVESV